MTNYYVSQSERLSPLAQPQKCPGNHLPQVRFAID